MKKIPDGVLVIESRLLAAQILSGLLLLWQSLVSLQRVYSATVRKFS
jgi:hypothetical protein